MMEAYTERSNSTMCNTYDALLSSNIHKLGVTSAIQRVNL